MGEGVFRWVQLSPEAQEPVREQGRRLQEALAELEAAVRELQGEMQRREVEAWQALRDRWAGEADR